MTHTNIFSFTSQSYAVIKKIDIKSMSEQEKKDTIKEAKILEVL